MLLRYAHHGGALHLPFGSQSSFMVFWLVVSRHPKLLKSKDISKYSAHDLSAILGVKTVKDEEQPAVVAEKEEGEGVQQEERKKSKKRRRAEVAEEEDAQVRRRKGRRG